MLTAKTVFVLAPHPDDAEFGCGGTIARLVENGAKVYFVVFTNPEDREKEMGLAAIVLGIEGIINLGLTMRRLNESRQDILDELIKLKKEFKPDLVFQPSLSDIHQDHQVVANEGLRAFKDTNLVGYEAIWNNLNFDAQMFVNINNKQLDKKIAAIKCYKSQNHKRYADEDYIRSLAKVRGIQIGFDNAEVFSVIRGVVS